MPDPFVLQLEELARRERTANKWVLVPDNQLGWMLAERLTLGGCNWLNLRFVTPFHLALESAAPTLLSEGVNPCPDRLGPALVQGLVLGHQLEPYRDSILQPGMGEWLWGKLWRGRMNGQKFGELEELYQSYLDQHRLADRAMVFQRSEATKVSSSDFVLAYPYHPWSLRERSFIENLPGEHVEPKAAAGTRAFSGQAFFYAGRRDIEFTEILRRISSPLDQVEIVAASEDLPLLFDLLSTYGCPATFQAGLPIELSRPGRALLGFLTWLETDFSGYHVREMLLGNLLKAKPNSWTAARILKAANVGWGMLEYAKKLAALIARKDFYQQQAQELASWFEELFSKLSSPADLHRWLDGIHRVLLEDLDTQEDGGSQIAAALLELRELPQDGWSLTQATQLVRERMRTLRWRMERPRPGHLHVSTPEWAGLSGRPTLFVTGCEEGREGNLPLDEEEQELAQQRALQRSQRLATLDGHVTFSYSSRNRAGDQEQIPAFGFPVSGLPTTPWTEEESELRRAFPLDIFPDLKRGDFAEAQRRSPEFTPWDGLVASAAQTWDPRSSLKAISVSRLQTLATCPFQFFLSHGLGLYPKPMPLADPDRWLDAATRGHILHALYARIVRENRFELAWLDELLAEQLPPPSTTVEAAERSRLLRDLDHFLNLESTRSTRQALGVEIPFGLGEADQAIASTDPVLLDLGAGMKFALQGRIDRLDRIEGGLSVVDYKTGTRLELAREGLYQKGRLLQHALYALAAEELTGEPVRESGYYFTSSHAAQTWVAFPRPDVPHLRRVLELVLHPVETGHFFHSHETSKDCGYCEYKAACAAHSDDHSRAKLRGAALAKRRELLEQP